MKIAVDRSLCRGHGQCELFAPDVFEVDDDALVVLKTETTVDGPAIRDAISHCPESAIRIVPE